MCTGDLSRDNASETSVVYGVLVDTAKKVKLYAGMDTSKSAACETCCETTKNGGEACPCMLSIGAPAKNGVSRVA